VDVPAGGESPVSRTSKDDATDVIVKVHLLHRVSQLIGQLVIHSIELFRAVQGDKPNAVFLFGKYEFVGHSLLL
jgi:hypothetical protein